MFYEILAGTECLFAGSGDDCYNERRFIVEPLDESVGFPVGVVREGVHAFSAVYGDEEDMGGGVGEDVGWCWRRFGGEFVGHCVKM